MIDFRVTYRDDGICKVAVTGHAGYADSGMDIVCSAASVLLYNAVNSCEGLLDAPLHVVDDGDWFVVEVPDNLMQHSGVQLLLRSLKFGFEQISEQYPEFVVVKSLKE